MTRGQATTSRTRGSAAHVVMIGALLLAGCQGFTREEAKQALEESQISSQAQALTARSAEIATHFTIGDAAEQAAEELRTFMESQLPCASITLTRATLSVEYGANPGSCLYRGKPFSGRHAITVSANAAEGVIVDHVWDDLSDGVMLLNGAATVTWSLDDGLTRNVDHTAEWTRLSDGRKGEGSGNRTQRALGGGITEGFSVEGSRKWKGKSGQWDLDIEGVEMRWIDPVPQAGTYTLDTPFDKSLSVTFERKSRTAITVTIEGEGKSYDFDVISLSAVDNATDGS